MRALFKLIFAELRRYYRSPIVLVLQALTVYNAYAFYVFSCGRVEKGPVEDLIYSIFSIPQTDFVIWEMLVLGITVSIVVGRSIASRSAVNKLVSGHSKGKIYCSSLIAAMIFGAVKGLSFSLVYVSLTWVPKNQTPALIATYIGAALPFVLIAAFFAASMLFIPNRSLAMVLCISLLLTGVFIEGNLEQSLNQPKIRVDLSGKVRDNPKYVSGIRRIIYTHIFDRLPFRQFKESTEIEWPLWIDQRPDEDEIYNSHLEKLKKPIAQTLSATACMFLFGYLIYRKKSFK